MGIFNLPIIDLLYTPTSEMLMIRLAELEREGRRELGLDAFREAVAKLGFIFLPLALFFIGIAPDFITALFTARYLGSVPVVACGIVLSCLSVDGTLRACNETRFIFFSYAIKFVVTIPLVLVGVTRFGMMGGVVSWLLADAIAKGSLVARLPRALGTSFSALLPWAELGRAAVASVLACGGIFAARMLVGPSHHAAVAVAATLYGVAYLLGLEAQGVQVPLPFPPSRAARGEGAAGQAGPATRKRERPGALRPGPLDLFRTASRLLRDRRPPRRPGAAPRKVPAVGAELSLCPAAGAGAGSRGDAAVPADLHRGALPVAARRGEEGWPPGHPARRGRLLPVQCRDADNASRRILYRSGVGVLHPRVTLENE